MKIGVFFIISFLSVGVGIIYALTDLHGLQGLASTYIMFVDYGKAQMNPEMELSLSYTNEKTLWEFDMEKIWY